MKSKTVTYLLWFFFGGFSLHRFYLGKFKSGIIYLLTLQLMGIGWIIDLFLISRMVENYNLNEEVNSIKKRIHLNIKLFLV